MAEITSNNKKRKIERVDFLSNHVVALKEALHTDVILKPSGDGPGIRTHKAVLAAKSKVFRDIFELTQGEITIPELNYEELESLLEFFYNGTLNPESKHLRALYVAADKYDIEYLQDECREALTSSLSPDNFFDIYELSTKLSDTILTKAVISFAMKNKNVFFSKGFKSFRQKNKDVSIEILLAFVKKLKPLSSNLKKSFLRYKSFTPHVS